MRGLPERRVGHATLDLLGEARTRCDVSAVEPGLLGLIGLQVVEQRVDDPGLPAHVDLGVAEEDRDRRCIFVRRMRAKPSNQEVEHSTRNELLPLLLIGLVERAQEVQVLEARVDWPRETAEAHRQEPMVG